MKAHAREEAALLAGGMGLLVLLAGLGLRQLVPPAPVAADAPMGAFSSGRAMKDVGVLALEPRPLGSVAHGRARDHLMRRLTADGLEPQVQRALAADGNKVACVHNVVARLPGTGGGKALLLSAHYDSVPNSAGAGDNAAAVAALLETARLLRAGPALAHDVIFLFSDGEEQGLLGARAFMAEHRWAADVGSVLNFDARGSGGPVMVFETGPASGRLIEALASTGPRAVASSLFPEVYRRLSNETDFDVFGRRGLPGLNFAFVGGLSHYHDALDDTHHLDERSVQHMGNHAVDLARHLAGSAPDSAASSSDLYFVLPAVGLVHYSARWSLPLLVLAAAAVLVLLGRAVLRGRVRAPRVALAFAAIASSMVLAFACVSAVWMIVRATRGELRRAPWGQPYDTTLYALAFVVLAGAIVWGASAALYRRLDGREVALGCLLIFLAGLTWTTVALPGASYLFAWPLLAGALGFALFLADPREAPLMRGLVATAVFSGAAGLILFAPVVWLLLTCLPVAFAPITVALVVVPVLWLFLPTCVAALGSRAWACLAIATAPCIWLVVVTGAGAEADGTRPAANSLFYGLDADSGTAFWMSTDRSPDPWTARYLSERPRSEPVPSFFPKSDDPVLLQSAPRVELAPPEVRWMHSEEHDGVTTVKLHLRSARGASELSVYVDAKSEVVGARVEMDGLSWSSEIGAAKGSGGWSRRFLGVPDAGVDLTLRLRSAGSARLRVVDSSYGLPTVPDGKAPSRPAGVIPRPHGTGISDLTMVARSSACDVCAASSGAVAASR
jgi:hypothetical protein